MALPDAETSLLLHCEGADASTTVTDSSIYGISCTPTDGAEIDTAQFKWGTSSLYFDGSSKLDIAANTGMTFGTGAWTIDFQIRFATVSGTRHLVAAGCGGSFGGPDNANGVNITWHSSAGLYIYIEGSAPAQTWTPTVDTWYHLEFARDGSNNLHWFVDGVRQAATASNSGDCTNSNTNYFGTLPTGALTNPFHGWLDEVRISKGVARHTTTFSAPTGPYDSEPDAGGNMLTVF